MAKPTSLRLEDAEAEQLAALGRGAAGKVMSAALAAIAQAGLGPQDLQSLQLTVAGAAPAPTPRVVSPMTGDALGALVRRTAQVTVEDGRRTLAAEALSAFFGLEAPPAPTMIVGVYLAWASTRADSGTMRELVKLADK